MRLILRHHCSRQTCFLTSAQHLSGPGSLPAIAGQQGGVGNRNSKGTWCQVKESPDIFSTEWCCLSSAFHHLCDAPMCRAMHSSLMTTLSELGETTGFSTRTGKNGQMEASGTARRANKQWESPSEWKETKESTAPYPAIFVLPVKCLATAEALHRERKKKLLSQWC